MSKDFVSDDDKKLFRNSVGAVTPLRKAKDTPAKTLCAKAIVPHKKNSYKPQPPSAPYLSSYIQENVNADTLLSWSSQSLPKKRWQEFQQGAIPYQDTLDLHGMTSDNAQKAFLHFMEQAYSTEKRCVLIVHGKGGLHGKMPIIKNLVNRWLQQHPYTRAFHSAAARHGGSGAVYVLLKKWQKN